jgi:hypothetical protein
MAIRGGEAVSAPQGCRVTVSYERTTDSERDKPILESGLLQGTK